MEFKIKVSIIKKIINKFSNLSYNPFLMPELNSILVEVYKDKISFEVKNDFVETRNEIHDVDKFDVKKEGAVLIRTKLLVEIFNKMNSEEVHFLQIEEKLLIIKTENAEYEINLMDKTKFIKTDFKIQNITSTLNINGNEFKELIESVLFSSNEKQSRKILQGINLTFKDQKLIALATDSIRIAKISIPWKNEQEFSKTIHVKSLKEILKMLELSEINITFSNYYAIFNDGQTLIKTQLIEGQFPDVSKVYPQNFKNILKIRKSELVDLIDKTLVLSSQRAFSDSLSIKFNINSKVLMLESRELEIGYASSKITNVNWEGDNIFLSIFNPNFVKDALKHIKDEEVACFFNEGDKPFQIEGTTNNALKCLILPLNIS